MGSASPALSAIEVAIANLNNTMHALVSKTTVRGDLGTAITVSEAWPNSGYTAESWRTFQDALTAAKSVYADQSATIEALSSALTRLMVAFQALSKS